MDLVARGEVSMAEGPLIVRRAGHKPAVTGTVLGRSLRVIKDLLHPGFTSQGAGGGPRATLQGA